MNLGQSEIWQEPFFNQMDTRQKLFYLYMKDNRDENGNFEMNSGQDSQRIGFDVDEDFIQSFVDTMNSDKSRIKKYGKLLRLTEPADPDPVEEFIRKQNATARTGNALKPKS